MTKQFIDISAYCTCTLYNEMTGVVPAQVTPPPVQRQAPRYDYLLMHVCVFVQPYPTSVPRSAGRPGCIGGGGRQAGHPGCAASLPGDAEVATAFGIAH